MSKGKWIIAGVAAGALALLTLLPFGADVLRNEAAPTDQPAVQASADAAADAGGEEAAGVCQADAKAADLGLTLKDMDGRDHALASHKGKVVVLNFWATWCAPCKYEIPALVELHAKYKDQGVAILGVSVDDPESKLKPFSEEYKINYPVLVGAERDDVERAYGPFWGIPLTVYVSRDGKICKKHTGLATKDQFERDIKALL